MPGVELRYAQQPQPLLRRRWVRWTLVAVAIVVLNAFVGRPLLDRAITFLDARRMQFDLEACLHFNFPPDAVAYSEGSPAQTEIATPWPRLRKSLGPLIRHSLFSGDRVIFLGERRNAAGESRLVIVTASGNSSNVTLQMQLIDPGNATTPPSWVAERRWELRRSKADRKLTISAGKPAVGPGDISIRMRHGDRDEILTASMATDEFELTGGPGWRDDTIRRWWLDDEHVDLVERDFRPQTIDLFDKANRVATPVATVNADGELVGVSLRGIQKVRLNAQPPDQSVTITTNWLADVRNDQVWNFDLSRDGSIAYVGGFTLGFPAVVSMQTGVVGPKFDIPVDRRHDAALSPDGRRVYVTAEGIGAAAFDVETGRELWRKPVTGATISAAGDRVAVVNGWMGKRSSVRVLSAEDGQIVQQVAIQNTFDCARLSPDGKRLAVTTDSHWKIVNLADGATMFLAPGEFSQSEPVWSPDGQVLAAVGKESVYVWDFAAPMIVYRMPATKLFPIGRRLMFTSDGSRMIMASSGRRAVQLWDVKSILQR